MENRGFKKFERTIIIENENFLTMIEPGYDIVTTGRFKGSSAEKVIEYSKAKNKEIKYIMFSHSHGDHVGNLPFYLKRIQNKVKIIGHINSPLFSRLIQNSLIKEEQIIKISKDTLFFENEENKINVICTPGHTRYGEDISMYLPGQKMLFIGDIYQPQGSSYWEANGLSPVPYFHHGNQYIKTLKRLLKLDFDVLVTGHGEVLNREDGLNGLNVTKTASHRIKELLRCVRQNHPDECLETLYLKVYDIIVDERNFNKNLAQSRKQDTPLQKSDYELYDRPSIQSFVV